MAFSVRMDHDTTVIAIEGVLTVSNRAEFRQLVTEEVARGGRQFRIDCRATSYIDSSGLGVLVSLSKAVRGRHGEIRIANLNPDLRTLLELTKLDTLFRFEDTGDDGLAGRPAPGSPVLPISMGTSESYPDAPGDTLAG